MTWHRNLLLALLFSVGCTSFGSASTADDGGATASDAALPSETGVDAARGDTGARDATADAPVLPDLGASCDVTSFALAKRAAGTFGGSGLGTLGMSNWEPDASADERVSTEACPGASGQCLHAELQEGAGRHASVKVVFNFNQSGVSQMRLCFHVYVELPYASLTSSNWYTLGGISSAGNPMTIVELWPKLSGGGFWSFVAHASQTSGRADAYWGANPPEDRTKRWHKVQLDTKWGTAGRTSMMVDGVQVESASTSLGDWSPVTATVYVGLRGTFAKPTHAWFQDVRLGWQ